MLKLNTLPSVQYQFFCSTKSEVPEEAQAYIHPLLLEKLGNSTRDIFPDFAKAFPFTIMALEKNWPLSMKLFIWKQFASKNWMHVCVLEGGEMNLYFNVKFRRSNELFDQNHIMLPERWKELYRWFDSFLMHEFSMGAFVYGNTPFHYSGRKDVDDFSAEFSVKKSELKNFSKSLESNKMYCWMVTDAGDSLWIDEDHCDRKVYHVKNHNFNDFIVLTDPEDVLDKYLAHYVSGGKVENFNFRI